MALFPKEVVLSLADLGSKRADPRLDAIVKPYETMLKSIVSSGGTIVAGTDAPIVPYGLSLHVELEEYVHAGMTPFQALQTATVNAAQALGLGDELGTIEPGKRADLTFIGGNPLQDIRNTRDVRRVMKGGRVYTLTELVSPVRK
jgi:imidazolonepropionase-like amidohydrolase